MTGPSGPRGTGARGGRGPERPLYKGAPLDPDRGPGLGCFWTQAILLAILVVLVPVGVWNGWPIEVTEALLVVTLILVFFVSLTLVFLLRLVAADRRARRAPLRSGARQTVGQLEDAARAATSESAPTPVSASSDAAAPSESAAASDTAARSSAAASGLTAASDTVPDSGTSGADPGVGRPPDTR
jgi:hypothetical protein